ncbi:MAG TPA: hypothetical protein VNV66_12725 [Pilimelia sp.]|nr:hypothetical protein [Pilimelia sp.]
MTMLQWGAFAFGAVLGWFTSVVNRHRTEVRIADVASIVGALGGAAVLALFPAETDLFAAYGLGLATGFFGYFVLLVLLVLSQRGWTMAWFLDGRRPPLEGRLPSDGSRPMGDGRVALHGQPGPAAAPGMEPAPRDAGIRLHG